MPSIASDIRTRRPRFRRLAVPPIFRVTDGDIAIIREIARHRFLRSTHVATLVGRSLDRTNERLSLLYHAGYIDRPRAQLDRFPTDGSSHMVYALADAGARLLKAHGELLIQRGELSAKNNSVLRPFIEHQLEIVDFSVRLQTALGEHKNASMIHPEEIIAAFPEATRADRNPLKLKVRLSEKGRVQNVGLIPDLVFGLRFSDGSRRCFMVEIDRGTMPVTRSDNSETSFALKMRAYLAAHAAGQHTERYGWKAFRVLTVTTDSTRVESMMHALRKMQMPRGPGASLFFFSTRAGLISDSPFGNAWQDGAGRSVALV